MTGGAGGDPGLLPLSDRDPSVPLRDDPDVAAALGEALRRAGYTAQGVERLVGAGRVDREPAEVPYLVRRVPRDGGAGTLARLFLVGVPVEAAEAAAALGEPVVASLRAAGVLVDRPEGVAATVAVTPVDEGLVVSDWEREDRLPVHADHVMGLSVSSRMLARLVPRDPVDSALDVGTGGGVQAFLAARHARRVVATDSNPRALLLARLAAGLNGVAGVEWRLGDLFAPVAGERFDLVVGNLPYVISPETTYLFRDGGRGRGLSEDVVRAAPRHLAEGGLACLMIGWVHGAGEPPWDAVRPWVRDLGCDALVLHHSSMDPLEHAAGWNRHHWRDPEAVASGVARWLHHLERLGAERVAWGAMVLRRRPGPGWFAGFSLPVGEVGVAGAQVRRLVAAQDLLAGGGEALLDARLAPAPDHRVSQSARLRAGEAEVDSVVLALDGGLGFRIALDEVTAGLLGVLDGRRTLREAAAELAAQAGGDAARLAGAVVPAVRRLVELGLVVPGG
ncbi:MAG: methyltransferase [Actinomycetota bacterium]